MIQQAVAQRVLEAALAKGADFAELFLEDKEELNIKFGATGVGGIAQAHLYGAGVYLLHGTQSAYVYTNDLSEKALTEAVGTAAALLGAHGTHTAAPLRAVAAQDPCPARVCPATIGHGEKIKLLQNAWKAAHVESSLIASLLLTYFDTDQRVTIANSEGVWAEDRRVTSRLRLLPTLASGGESVGHFADFTRAKGFEAFGDESYLDFARQVIRDAQDELFAAEAPSAFVPVVFEAGGCTGTFFHEACGHQLEASGMNGGSLFRDRLGEKIASKKVTLVDDGTLPGQYGSSAFDDEGMPRQRNVLIENGVLKSFLADRLGARQLQVPRTASGRRQGYTYAPKSRMSNTFLAAGPDDDDEMIRSMPEGLFVTEIGGGTGGAEFTLLAKKAFWVKNGRIDRQVKGAMLLGRGDETMLNIDRVGSVLVYEDGGAFCGADSGLVNTTTSGARMRVTGMVVGGKGEKL